MINENKKSYKICDECCNAESCEYYEQTTQAIKQFANTPLNIHFPKCNNYKSHLNKFIERIENSDVIPYVNNLKDYNLDELIEIIKIDQVTKKSYNKL